jgi:hypothetical protein
VQDEADAYIPFGVAPPPAPGFGYYAADASAPGTNGFAIAAFILGLVGGVLFSVIFGILALRKIRERPQRGKGLAIAGLCLSGLWLVGVAAGFALVSASTAQRSAATGQITRSGHLGVFSLRAGDCFNNPTGSQPASVLKQVTALPCTSAHNAQVMALLPVAGSAYPGAAAFRAQALQGCRASIAASADHSKLTATMQLLWIYPEPQAWADGQRTISCLVVDSSPDLTSSLMK